MEIIPGGLSTRAANEARDYGFLETPMATQPLGPFSSE